MNTKKLKTVKNQTNKTMKELADDFGKMAFLSDEEQLFILPTIFPSFNRASRVGGLPGGSIVELHGPNQGGKTALGIALLVSAQQHGHVVAIIDYEGSFKDKKWPKALGLDLQNVLYQAPYSFEEGADAINDMLRKFEILKRKKENKHLRDKMLLVLVDSFNGMVPKDELEGNVGKRNFGLRANLSAQWFPILNTLLKRTQNSVILVNQERTNQGARMFEKKWRTAGGEAIKFYAHFRVRVLQSSKTVANSFVVGKQHRFIVEKNKVSAPDEMGYFFTSNGKLMPLGFDLPKTYFHEGLVLGIFEKSSKTRYSSESLHKFFPEDGRSEKSIKEMIRDNSSFRQALENQFVRRTELEKSHPITFSKDAGQSLHSTWSMLEGKEENGEEDNGGD